MSPGKAHRLSHGFAIDPADADACDLRACRHEIDVVNTALVASH
jgi:hypothetical protein